VNAEYINNLYTITDNYAQYGLSEPQKESYMVIDSKISYLYSKNLDVFLTGKNLTGTNYQISYGYPMPKQILMGGVNIHF
jgi:outer membrane receptor for monomeric catechols